PDDATDRLIVDKFATGISAIRWAGMGAGKIQAVIAVMVLLAILAAPPASAQTQEQIEWCTGVKGTLDEKIEGCTAMIESRQYHGEQLAILFNRRGIAYNLKRSYDQAIEDYNQSIMYDVSNSDTMYNRGLAYSRKGDFQRAIADFNRAIERHNPTR